MEGLLECGIIRKTNPPPFLLKTYMLVDDPATDAVISWNEGGAAFVVWQPAEFARDLLPTLFKHSNFSSFVRQLNTYGFKKVATSRWEFCNDKFQRGKRDLLCQIRRRKAWSNRQQPPTTTVPTDPPGTPRNPVDELDQRSSSTSSPSEQLNTLVDENKRLKKENGVLNYELTTMKKKCKDLLDLVAICTNNNNNQIEEKDQIYNGEIDEDGYEIEDEKRLKLFGVRLDVHAEKEERRKRKRSSSAEIYETARLLLSQSCK